MKKIALFTVLLFSFATALAEVVDLGTVEAGKTYTLPGYQTVKGQYTPAATGPVKFVSTSSDIPLYTSADANEDNIVYGSNSYGPHGEHIVSYSSLQGGKTYYLYSGFVVQGGEFTIQEGETKIEFVGITPKATEEHPFSVSSDYRIYVDFNYPVTIGNAFLLVGDGQEENRVQIYPLLSHNSVSCDVYSTVMNFYHRGVLKGGDKMTLRIMQVKDAMDENSKYNTTGKFEIEIPVAAKPAELQSAKGVSFQAGRNVMNSYYMPGSDEGKITLTFDSDIDASKIPAATLTYGNADNLELGMYNEQLAGTVDGRNVTFDFSGKLRRKTDMLPAATADELVEDIFVSFGNIFTPDGQRAYTGVMSNPNGFATSMTVNDLQYNIAADFTPGRGSALTPGTEVEIWVMNGALIHFDNVCIDYTSAGEPKTLIIPADAITEKADDESPTGLDKLYYFTVPEYSADADSNVYVYMSNLLCADGLDHSADVRGNFKDSETSIAEISAIKADNAIYDLSGRKVSRAAKGIYIINGNKTFIK